MPRSCQPLQSAQGDVHLLTATHSGADRSRFMYVQQVSTRTSLEEGMALWGLTDSELFWDQGSDTKMLMAWSRTCVVCAFRGTASLSNAMSDLQV